VRPNTIVYSSAIAACGSAGEWRRALQLLDEMVEVGIQPNTITYNAALQVSHPPPRIRALTLPTHPDLSP
jgi:pentatricopeptide repeat protein